MIPKKKILVLAPACLPITSAESIVNAKLLSALSRDGRFEIDLVSKLIRTGPYPIEPDFNEFGIKLNQYHLIEVDNKFSAKTVIGHIKAFLKFGTAPKGSHWASEALNLVDRLVKDKHYDYVLTKNFPSLLLGSYLKRKYGITWIATWNDPFPQRKYPAPYGEGTDVKLNYLDNKMLSIMEKYADMHIFPSSRLRDYMLKYLNIPMKKTTIIPHVAFSRYVENVRKTNSLNLLHSGNLGHPRTPKYLFEALRNFLNDIPQANFKLTIQGRIEEEDIALISKLGLSDKISILPPVPYRQSIKSLKDYDVAIIIEAPCKEGIFLPTKVSDFMEEGIPILALSPHIGTLNDLYKDGYIPYFAETDDIEKIAHVLKRIYLDFEDGALTPSHICPSYSIESVTDAYYSFK